MKNMTKQPLVDDDDDCDNDPKQAWNEFCAKLTSEARSAMERVEQDAVAGKPRSRPDRSVSHHGNGPAAKGRFYWNRKFIDLRDAHLQYRLLVALWDADAGRPYDERDEEDVIEEVWGHNNQTVTKNLKDLTYECNIKFRQNDAPFCIHRGCGKIWLDKI